MPETKNTQFQQVSLSQHKAQQELAKQKAAKTFKLPVFVKIILASPLIVIGLFGLFYIPYLAIASISSGDSAQKTVEVRKR